MLAPAFVLQPSSSYIHFAWYNTYTNPFHRRRGAKIPAEKRDPKAKSVIRFNTGSLYQLYLLIRALVL